VSTGIAGIPREKHKIIAAVLGPMPSILLSHFFASSSGISARNDRSNDPISSRTRTSTSFIRLAFIRYKPADLIHFSIWEISASAISFNESKFSINVLKALSELISEVCCDKIVNTNSSAGLYRGSQSNGPYSLSSESIRH